MPFHSSAGYVEEGDRGLFVAMLASLPLPKGPGSSHPPVPNSATAGQQECTDNPLSAPARLSGLRGRAGSRGPRLGQGAAGGGGGSRGSAGRGPGGPVSRSIWVPGGRRAGRKLRGAPHPAGRCWGACGRPLGRRHSERRPRGGRGRAGCPGGSGALVPAGVSAFWPKKLQVAPSPGG